MGYTWRSDSREASMHSLPVSALDANEPLDKHRCHSYLLNSAQSYPELDVVEVCGKCAIGLCSFSSAV